MQTEPATSEDLHDYPGGYEITRKGAGRQFENDFLERLSHVHPITPLLMWGPIAAWLIWRSFALYNLPVLPVLW